jgi:beta-xylosidase
LEDFPGRYDRQPNQGGLVQTPGGDWWFITHQGRGENGEDYLHARRGDADANLPRPMDLTGTYDGRPANLLPVKWVAGWPIPGAIDKNGAGNITWTVEKPVNGFPIQVPQSSDEFTALQLGPQWEWNYQPRQEKWSLTARPGWLRLHAFRPLRPDDFFKAGNTLTQRILGTGRGEVLAKLDVTGMADGQTAGMCIFWKEFCTFGVVQQNGVRNIELNNNGTRTKGAQLKSGQTKVWVKAIITDQGRSNFAWSLDGNEFTPIGDDFKFGWGNYRGTRLGICSYNNEAEAGFVDVDFFHYRYDGPQNKK